MVLDLVRPESHINKKYKLFDLSRQNYYFIFVSNPDSKTFGKSDLFSKKKCLSNGLSYIFFFPDINIDI